MGGNVLMWISIVSSFAGIAVESWKVSCAVDATEKLLKCQCPTPNVEWYKNRTRIATCNPILCHPNSSRDHEFTPSTNHSTITIAGFHEGLCSSYACKDISTQTTEFFPDCVDFCECKLKFDGGNIVFTLFVYLSCIVYTGVVVWLRFKYYPVVPTNQPIVWVSTLVDLYVDVMLWIFTLVVLVLEVCFTITILVNDNQQDCETACHDKCCTYTLRVVLTVLAWLVFGVGCFMFLYRVIKDSMSKGSKE